MSSDNAGEVCGASPRTPAPIVDPDEQAFWRAVCVEPAGHDGRNWHTPHRATGLGRHGSGTLTWYDDDRLITNAPRPTRPVVSVPALQIAGGVVVTGTTVLLAGQLHPALQFTFLAPQGGSYAPMTVVVGEPQLDELPDVLHGAIALAREASQRSET